MTYEDAEQLALDGLAPRKRRKRTPVAKTPAAEHPIAQVVLDVQATHLGQTFDYYVEEQYSDAARPGVMVRVRFGGQRVNGIIWSRADTSDTPASALRFIERVVTDGVLVPRTMREDITLIADAFGGTRANILRLAVPPRVARVEQEQRRGGSTERESRAKRERLIAVEQEFFDQLKTQYGGISLLRDALGGSRFQSFVFDTLPGSDHWRRCVAWMVATALSHNRPAVIVLPTMREVSDMVETLQSIGLRMFARTNASSGGYDGDIAVLNAQMSPAERYRAYLAASNGRVPCIIGTRAAMYAPVEGRALFLIVDDVCYQDADGMMPYANARGVLRLRAKAHGGVFVAMANSRSVQSQWETDATHVGETPVSGFSTPIHALPAVTKETSPWIRWLNRDELARVADPTIGARVPHTAVRVLSKALESGPVLLSIPQDGITEALSCSQCHRQARCAQCTGPLERLRDGSIRCRWCGAATVQWSCPACHNERMRVVRVGAAGTAQELGRLFRGVPIVISTPSQPRGIVPDIAFAPQLVIATPGAEPRVRGTSPYECEYRAVAILDAWTSLYAFGIDAGVDTLTAWMRAVSLCAPRSRSGQALLLGETDPVLAQSLMLWNSPHLAQTELEERAQTALPPVFAAACVWGRRSAVKIALERIGALPGGDMATIDTVEGVMPSVLGPVPIPQPRTIDTRELEVTADRVKAIVRVPQSGRAELALRLRNASARHVAAREAGELRFQLDPKERI
ncbi:primosomal protein N' [Bifidobacterium moukalabense]|uniref:primosomal protein N' n=1 Tax=Bifidobacterium moukalabense TaxID=1333651 RepID=UPI0010F86C9B|nr:primosomal protein N' [Bifidobacterium moukalabense]